MIVSIAIQSYFGRLRQILGSQGFQYNMPIVYAADENSNLSRLDKELASAKMDRKSRTDAASVRSDPFAAIFWGRSEITNVNRRSYGVLTTENGKTYRQNTVSSKFTMNLVVVSNKSNLIEDFEEAFAANYQNMHSIPLITHRAATPTTPEQDENSLKFVYGTDGNAPATFTVTQELGSTNFVKYRDGNLFAYSWHATIYMNYVSDFLKAIGPERVKFKIVDIYAPDGFRVDDLDMSQGSDIPQYVPTPKENAEHPEMPTPLEEASIQPPTLPDGVPYYRNVEGKGTLIQVEGS